MKTTPLLPETDLARIALLPTDEKVMRFGNSGAAARAIRGRRFEERSRAFLTPGKLCSTYLLASWPMLKLQ
jgi:hypothetical protein